MKKLVILDLDGTLITGNSFHEFIKCAFADAMKHKKFICAFKFIGWCFLRAIRVVSHSRMKFGILASCSYSESLKLRFCKKIKGMFRPSMIVEINKAYLENSIVLLATAAPDIYIPWFWKGDYVATETTGNSGMTECKGKEKLRRVLEFLRKECATPSVIYTDHYDDLPLLEIENAETVLVSPSLKTREIIEKAGVKVSRIIDS